MSVCHIFCRKQANSMTQGLCWKTFCNAVNTAHCCSRSSTDYCWSPLLRQCQPGHCWNTLLQNCGPGLLLVHILATVWTGLILAHCWNSDIGLYYYSCLGYHCCLWCMMVLLALTSMTWCEENLCNFIVLQTVHLSNFFLIYTWQIKYRDQMFKNPASNSWGPRFKFSPESDYSGWSFSCFFLFLQENSGILP
jgi:hypothetical protein